MSISQQWTCMEVAISHYKKINCDFLGYTFFCQAGYLLKIMGVWVAYLLYEFVSQKYVKSISGVPLPDDAGMMLTAA